MPDPYYRPFNDPAVTKGFDDLAKAFVPDPRTMLAGAKAAEAQQKIKFLSDFYKAASDPNFNPGQADAAGIAAGAFTPTTGFGARNMHDATQRYGYDQQLTGTKYSADASAGAARYGHDLTYKANIYNTDAGAREKHYATDVDADTKIKTAYMNPVKEGETRFLPPTVADQFKAPTTQYGGVTLKPGDKTVMAGPNGTPGGGPTLQGNPKPLTDSETLALVLQGMTPDEQKAVAMKDVKPQVVMGDNGKPTSTTTPQMLRKGQVPLPQHPAATYNYPTPDGKQGTAVWDPTQNTYVDSQSKQPLPSSVPLRQATGPSTQVNIDSSGNTYGQPEKGFAYVRNPDNSIKLGPNGAPMIAPMQGGPEFDKQKKAADAAVHNQQNADLHNNIALQDVDRALKIIEDNPGLSTGFIGQHSAGVGGTPAANLGALLQGIKGNISLERLQALRDASPTGAALGRVTNQEVTMLSSAFGSMEQSQSAQQLAETMTRYRQLLATVIGGQNPASSAPGATSGATSGQPQQAPMPTPEEAQQELERRRKAAGGR
jgi:hypothetical protein